MSDNDRASSDDRRNLADALLSELERMRYLYGFAVADLSQPSPEVPTSVPDNGRSPGYVSIPGVGTAIGNLSGLRVDFSDNPPSPILDAAASIPDAAASIPDAVARARIVYNRRQAMWDDVSHAVSSLSVRVDLGDGEPGIRILNEWGFPLETRDQDGDRALRHAQMCGEFPAAPTPENPIIAHTVMGPARFDVDVAELSRVDFVDNPPSVQEATAPTPVPVNPDAGTGSPRTPPVWASRINIPAIPDYVPGSVGWLTHPSDFRNNRPSVQESTAPAPEFIEIDAEIFRSLNQLTQQNTHGNVVVPTLAGWPAAPLVDRVNGPSTGPWELSSTEFNEDRTYNPNHGSDGGTVVVAQSGRLSIESVPNDSSSFSEFIARQNDGIDLTNHQSNYQLNVSVEDFMLEYPLGIPKVLFTHRTLPTVPNQALAQRLLRIVKGQANMCDDAELRFRLHVGLPRERRTDFRCRFDVFHPIWFSLEMMRRDNIWTVTHVPSTGPRDPSESPTTIVLPDLMDSYPSLPESERATRRLDLE